MGHYNAAGYIYHFRPLDTWYLPSSWPYMGAVKTSVRKQKVKRTGELLVHSFNSLENFHMKTGSAPKTYWAFDTHSTVNTSTVLLNFPYHPPPPPLPTHTKYTFPVLSLGVVELNEFLIFILVSQHPLTLSDVEVVVWETYQGPNQSVVARLIGQPCLGRREECHTMNH